MIHREDYSSGALKASHSDRYLTYFKIISCCLLFKIMPFLAKNLVSFWYMVYAERQKFI